MDQLATKFLWSLRLNGVRGTARVAEQAVRRRLQRQQPDEQYCVRRDAFFDEHLGVETAGCVEIDALDLSDEAKATTNEYRPTSAVSAAVTLDVLPIDKSKYHFFDIGCGKGRILVIAGQMPFRSVTGIELSPTLAECARANVANRRGPKRSGSVDVIEGDAVRFDVPPGPLVVYLYNPFDEPLVRALEAHVRTSLDERSRDCWVVYANAVHRHLFDDSPHWNEHPHGDHWWGVYRWTRS